MNPSIADFEIHLSHPAPGFRCYAAGDETLALRFTASVTHQLKAPAKQKELGRLESLLGWHDPDLHDLYERYNGFTLYCDTRSDDAGVRFFPVEELESTTREVLGEFREMETDKLYGDLCDGVVIGEIPKSWNYFFYQTAPTRRGSIYYLMHDPLYEEGLRFESIGDLLSSIISDPPQFLYDLGCYTRFSDGVTDNQWIPSEYLRDAKSS